jgi:hypothetical protein
MTKNEATAEVFWMAFSALPRGGEPHSVLVRMMDDRALRHDLIDIALIEERRDEPERPFREYLDAVQGRP